jgi:hypothetical protein
MVLETRQERHKMMMLNAYSIGNLRLIDRSVDPARSRSTSWRSSHLDGPCCSSHPAIDPPDHGYPLVPTGPRMDLLSRLERVLLPAGDPQLQTQDVSLPLPFFPSDLTTDYTLCPCSATGLSQDFSILNPLGFALYASYTLLLTYSPLLRAQYAARNAGHEPQVSRADIAFSVHAFILSSIVLLQTFWYSRRWARGGRGASALKYQRLADEMMGTDTIGPDVDAWAGRGKPGKREPTTAWTWGSLVGIAGVVCVGLGGVWLGKLEWLDFVYLISYVKLYIRYARTLSLTALHLISISSQYGKMAPPTPPQLQPQINPRLLNNRHPPRPDRKHRLPPRTHHLLPPRTRPTRNHREPRQIGVEPTDDGARLRVYRAAVCAVWA